VQDYPRPSFGGQSWCGDSASQDLRGPHEVASGATNGDPQPLKGGVPGGDATPGRVRGAGYENTGVIAPDSYMKCAFRCLRGRAVMARGSFHARRSRIVLGASL
jgi:hypothetical protein